MPGDPALGPTPYVHRPSADANPTAPLGHHTLDSTHATHGVVTGGLTHHEVTVEASWFRGRELDEDRVRLDWASSTATARGSRGGAAHGARKSRRLIWRFPLAALVAAGVNR